MNDPIIRQFAEACGVTDSLHLRVDLAGGGVLDDGMVPMPFTLVGRDDSCDVTLTDADVNPRHAWLQAIQGHVFAIDLGSRTGLTWPGGERGSGWFDCGSPVRIGPFEVYLQKAVAAGLLSVSPQHNPLQSDPNAIRACPPTVLEFRNGKRAHDRWTVNRLITLVGRSPECKIHLTGEDIVSYHCGLVLTASGLWVVDLSGRGVVVNGERMRVAPLPQGAELRVGRFLIGVHHPPAHTSVLTVQPATVASPVVAGDLAEDEVQLGVTPHSNSDAGLSSSHLMADAFQLWASVAGVTGPISHPVFLAGSGIQQSEEALPIPAPPLNRSEPGRLDDLFLTPMPQPRALSIGGLLRKLGEHHTKMFDHYQQSLLLMVELFGKLHRDQVPRLQRELQRLQELNAELAHLQTELARRAVESQPVALCADPCFQSLDAGTDSTALHEWVADRLHTLQHERQTLWQSLLGLFENPTAVR